MGTLWSLITFTGLLIVIVVCTDKLAVQTEGGEVDKEVVNEYDCSLFLNSELD